MRSGASAHRAASAGRLRPVGRRRGGAGVVVIGFVGVGGSAALVTLIGDRLISPAQFSGLAIALTIANVFGFGIGIPVEQVLTRRLNVVAAHAIRRPLSWLMATAAVVIAGIVVFAGRTAAASSFPALVPAAIAAVCGWVAVALVRGRLAGSGDLIGYAAVLTVEGVSRIVLTALAIADRSGSAVLLGAAVGAPLILAALTGSVIRLPSADGVPALAAAEPELAPVAAVRGEQSAFIAVSLGFQACLNAAPIVIEWRVGSSRPDVVGAFFAASSYFLVPTVLMGGVTTHALVELSRTWAARDVRRFRAAIRVGLRNITVTSIAATVLAALLSPVLLPIYNEHTRILPRLLLVALALSSLLAVLAAVLVQPLLAAGRSAAAGSAWVCGALVTLGIVGLSSGTDHVAMIGLVAGPAAATAVALFGVQRLLHNFEASAGKMDRMAEPT